MKTKLGALVLTLMLFATLPFSSSSAYVAVSVGIAPPVIPVYEQPLCPAPGYIWTPGYWAWGAYGYYWVPGTWVLPPRVGLLWTPGYWGYNGGSYVFHDGYWGPTVGFYGGINYGYGYTGYGYYGGRWVGHDFHYNTAVTRVNTTVIHNTYVNREAVRNTGSRAGFNGPGGAQARPTAEQTAAAKAEHVGPTAAQRTRAEAARNDSALRAGKNKQRPNATAVQNFNRQHGERAAAAAQTANSGSARPKASATRNQARPSRTVDNSGAAARANHRERVAPNSHTAHKANEVQRSQTRKPVNQPHVVKHQQAPSRQPQVVRGRPAGPEHAGQPQENGKKKKKRDQGKPND